MNKWNHNTHKNILTIIMWCQESSVLVCFQRHLSAGFSHSFDLHCSPHESTEDAWTGQVFWLIWPPPDNFVVCSCRQQDLYRILKAYTIYRPDEGYCQAQAPVAAVLLMHMPAEVRGCEPLGCMFSLSGERSLSLSLSPSLPAEQWLSLILLMQTIKIAK